MTECVSAVTGHHEDLGRTVGRTDPG